MDEILSPSLSIQLMLEEIDEMVDIEEVEEFEEELDEGSKLPSKEDQIVQEEIKNCQNAELPATEIRDEGRVDITLDHRKKLLNDIENVQKYWKEVFLC